MNRFVKILFIIAVFSLLVWIDLPDSIRSKFKIPSGVNTKIFGIPVNRDFKTKLGLDLKGGSHLVFETDTAKIKKEDIEEAISSARDTIERRVNFFGISEPSVQTLKSGQKYRISVDLPGIEKVDEAVKLIGQTAQLQFKEMGTVDEKVATSTPIYLLLTKDTGLTGKHIKKASVQFDSQTGKPQVGLSFSSEGAKLFADITKRNVGKPVGIFIDNAILSAPVVQQEILDGNAVITGNFSVDESKKLSIAINSGALPVPIKMVEQRNIGPTLGGEEISKSTYAGLIGLAMVFIFMVAYYGRFGLIASAALIIYGLISFAIFRTIPVVMTLSGVAGFILSIGMAVDSNILIFERIKEEQRKGKDLDIAIKLGFGRAIDAIKDANVTTLIVAFILFNPLNWDFLPQFGMVKGFALTLAIGVATSLFTGVVITKRIIDLFYLKNQK